MATSFVGKILELADRSMKNETHHARRNETYHSNTTHEVKNNHEAEHDKDGFGLFKVMMSDPSPNFDHDALGLEELKAKITFNLRQRFNKTHEEREDYEEKEKHPEKKEHKKDDEKHEKKNEEKEGKHEGEKNNTTKGHQNGTNSHSDKKNETHSNKKNETHSGKKNETNNGKRHEKLGKKNETHPDGVAVGKNEDEHFYQNHSSGNMTVKGKNVLFLQSAPGEPQPVDDSGNNGVLVAIGIVVFAILGGLHHLSKKCKGHGGRDFHAVRSHH